MDLNFHVKQAIDTLFAQAPKQNHQETIRAKAAVEKCIANWSIRNTPLLIAIFYRITQFFATLIGFSDSQIAKRSVIVALAVNMEIKASTVSKPIYHLINKISDKALEILTLINDKDISKNQNPLSHTEVQAELSVDLPSFLLNVKKEAKPLAKDLNKMFQKINIDLVAIAEKTLNMITDALKK